MLPPKAMKVFMMQIYSVMEKDTFAQRITVNSFSDVGLCPWCPERIGELCQEHCPLPSKLNRSCVLRKFERIMKTLSAEQETEQNRITSIGKSEREESSENSGRYQLRERKGVEPEESEDETEHSFP